jgi:hypothetical protein
MTDLFGNNYIDFKAPIVHVDVLRHGNATKEIFIQDQKLQMEGFDQV